MIGVKRPIKLSEAAKQSNETRRYVDELIVPSKDAKGGFLSRAMGKIGEKFHSPDVTMDRNPFSAEVYRLTEEADRAGKKFLAEVGAKYRDVTDGIEMHGPVDRAVHRLRDNQLTMKEVLSMPEEQVAKLGFKADELAAMASNQDDIRRLNNFYTQVYDTSLRNWGRERVGEQVEKDLWSKVRAVKGNKDLEDGLDVAKKSMAPAEQEVLDQYLHIIPSYTPHLFDKAELKQILVENLKDANLRLRDVKPGTAEFIKIERERDMLSGSIDKLGQGKLVLREDLPRSVKFGFFEKRLGMKGYSESSMESFERYIHGIARKTYDEPAIQKSIDLYEKVPDDMKGYVKDYLRHFAGYDKTDPLADSIKSFEWMRTLGLNPRSAVTNLTQRVNTYADVPIKDALLGQKFAFTPDAEKLFVESGLDSLVSEKMMEGARGANAAMEKTRNLVGFMFNKVERGNLKHAFSTGYLQGIKSGMSEKDAIIKGVKLAEKHHFRYGRVGTSPAMRGWGGVGLQFAGSYPVKQLEFLSKIAREDPAKLVKWIALSEGVKGTVADVLGVDMSNALGVPVDVGQVVSTLASITEGDLRKAGYHADKSITRGGFMPQGFGPALEALIDVKDAPGIGGKAKTIAKNITPVVGDRMYQAVRGLMDKEEDKYPVYSTTNGSRLYNAGPNDMLRRMLLGRPVSEKAAMDKVSDERKLQRMGTDIIGTINERLAKGDAKGAVRLMDRYGLKYTDEGVKAAILRMRQTSEERIKVPTSRVAFEEYMQGKR